jgi:D-methionine transport system permease protein
MWGLTDRQVMQLQEATGETLYMVGIATLIAVLAGLPLGILLATTSKGGVFQFPTLYRVLGVVINVGRSLPFIILMVAIMPFTRQVAGTTIGTMAAIVPLAVASIPFFARLVESALLEVDRGLIEMIQASGGKSWDVVRKALVPEAIPSLIRAVTVTLINLIGYSAMAGVIGGGGLGDLAYRYGYQRFEGTVMIWTIVALLVLVQLVQVIGDFLARLATRR